MKAGSLRHRVEVQRASELRDKQGGVVSTWGTIAHRWASIEPLKGREFWSAQQVQSEITHTVRMRYVADLTPTQCRLRTLHRQRIFDIKSVLDSGERRRELIMRCVESIPPRAA